MRRSVRKVGVIAAVVIAVSAWFCVPTSEAQRRSDTPTAGEVVADLQDAIDRENWREVASYYASDAFILADQGILVGHRDIITAYQSLTDLFNGLNPQIIQVSEFGDTVRVLYSYDAGWVVIPDGVDTYVVEDGLITRQTSHGLIDFTGPPPDQN